MPEEHFWLAQLLKHEHCMWTVRAWVPLLNAPAEAAHSQLLLLLTLADSQYLSSYSPDTVPCFALLLSPGAHTNAQTTGAFRLW